MKSIRFLFFVIVSLMTTCMYALGVSHLKSTSMYQPHRYRPYTPFCFSTDNSTGINNVKGFSSLRDQEVIYNLHGYMIPNSQLSTKEGNLCTKRSKND